LGRFGASPPGRNATEFAHRAFTGLRHPPCDPQTSATTASARAPPCSAPMNRNLTGARLRRRRPAFFSSREPRRRQLALPRVPRALISVFFQPLFRTPHRAAGYRRVW
jgi:hypothetical protein